jgi:hypothetical protein
MAEYAFPPKLLTSDKEEKVIKTLHNAIGIAIEERGRRYEAIKTFAITFEEDDSNAARDVQHFQTILKLLKLPAANEITISATDYMPGWEFLSVVRNLQVETSKVLGQSLIIGFYAGHGVIGDNGSLCFKSTADSLKEVNFRRFWGGFWDDANIFQRTDVILILDCCYAGAALRSAYTATRTVEVIAAVEGDQRAFGNQTARTQNNTFTARLTDEISQQVGATRTNGLYLRDVIQEMRRKAPSPERLPVYKIFIGSTLIKILLPPRLQSHTQGRLSGHQDSSSSSSTPFLGYPLFANHNDEYTAVFTVHIPSPETQNQEHEALVLWVRSLDPALGIQVIDIYKTRSVTLLLHVKWSMWATLDGLPGVSLVSETYGRGQLHPFPPSLSRPLNQQPASTKSEEWTSDTIALQEWDGNIRR